MPQSLAQIYVHIVFSTRDRRPQRGDDGLRDRPGIGRAIHVGLGQSRWDYLEDWTRTQPPGQRQGSQNSPCLALGFDRAVPSGRDSAPSAHRRA